jgi:N-acetylmuramic acid 6-phosphate (MurNAc-6-P) etherase
VLNPVVGPEAIAGSTRLKGGSATKMLLETIGISAIQKVTGNGEALFPGANSSETDNWWIDQYQKVYRNTYLQKEPIGSLIELGGRALKSGKHIYYFGQGSLGLLGVIDASECPPTFGADFDDVRGFVPGGWDTLEWNCSLESGSLPMPSFDQDEFEKGILNSLLPNDLVVGLTLAEEAMDILPVLTTARERGANCAAIVIGRVRKEMLERVSLDCAVELDVEPTGKKEHDQCFAELAVKIILNALSTGAHVLAGKAYSNRMIDLRITNSKLYERAIRMVSALGGVDAIRAEQALKAVILRTKRAVSEDMSISETIGIASTKKRVIPEAVLVARSGFSPQEAAKRIQGNPVLRHFLENTPDG